MPARVTACSAFPGVPLYGSRLAANAPQIGVVEFLRLACVVPKALFVNLRSILIYNRRIQLELLNNL